jgi:hypothetical protein
MRPMQAAVLPLTKNGDDPTSFTSVRTEADLTAWGKHLTAPP